MNNKISRLIGALGLAMTLPVWATTVTYDLANISGNTWEYTYSVSNDTLAQDIEEFTIFFDLALYENLVATATPAGWDPLVIQPDPGLPDDGFYDALALTVAAGIAPGGALSGFGVQFDFLGVGTPGAQPFDIVDPLTFNTLDSGTTQLASVPVPAALWLFGSGLLGLVGAGTNNRHKRSIELTT